MAAGIIIISNGYAAPTIAMATSSHLSKADYGKLNFGRFYNYTYNNT